MNLAFRHQDRDTVKEFSTLVEKVTEKSYINVLLTWNKGNRAQLLLVCGEELHSGFIFPSL